jgi:HEAT repeat protein
MSPEEIDQIFEQTLTPNYDDEGAWEAVRKLHLTGGREVYERAAGWCQSGNSLKRARGADILAQLGRTEGRHSHDFPDECFSVVSGLVQREKESLPLLSAVHALGHIGNLLAVPMVIEHRLHPSADVRFAVACALGNFANDKRAVDALVALMQDSDEDVRDWATFGLGVQGDLDFDEIRDALFERLSDPGRNVRGESLLGLAKRQDQRALPALIAELNQPEPSDRAFEAAETFVGGSLDEPERNPSQYIAAIKQRFCL